jgi:hypothetical protein
MDHDADWEAERAVRALLVDATGGGPPETDLLGGVRRRVARRRARRRVLAASLATLSAASAIAVAALLVPVTTGTPSAQARVAAAAGRTSTEGYRVQIVYSGGVRRGAEAGKSSRMEGAFDPARRTGRLRLPAEGLEVRFVGGMVYMELPARQRPRGKHWLAQEHRFDPHLDAPALVRLTKLAWQDPQRELARLRSAAAVRELGSVAGDGWSGRRYAFELAAGKDVTPSRVTGTVDVDQAGRVRRLEVGTTPAGAVHMVMVFRDFGARETVLAPPAHQVVHAREWHVGKAKAKATAPNAKR